MDQTEKRVYEKIKEQTITSECLRRRFPKITFREMTRIIAELERTKLVYIEKKGTNKYLKARPYFEKFSEPIK